MEKKKPGLSDAYAVETPDDSRRLYADWAQSYDDDFAAGMDYRLPENVAGAFADANGSGPVLDVGAGTGLVANALRRAGIGPIDATDISPQMLEIARGKGLYRDLFVSDITQPLDIPCGQYRGIVSAGTFTLGHVGPEALDELLRITAPGGLCVIAINAAHYKAAGFADTLQALSDQVHSLTLSDVAIYGAGAVGDHADDKSLIAVIRVA